MLFFKRSKRGNGRANAPSPPSEATFIAKDMRVEGNLTCDGELHIDGRVIGSIRAQTCLVDVHASVTGDISADTVYIYGEVNGPVDANHVHIYASAQVRGDVINESLSIENGAVIQGAVRNGRSQPFSSAFAPTSPFSASQPAPANALPSSGLFGSSAELPYDETAFRPVKVVNPRR